MRMLLRVLLFGAACFSAVAVRADEAANHWAYRPITRPAVPDTKQFSAAARSALDRFILAKLETERLAPAGPADKATLLRRATLALTGLLPTPDELDAFLANDSPDAYEREIDRLLASPQHGERMASYWLDLARYADTHGYHADTHRDMWRWRDWVVDAFNRDMPFDQFTIEQLAGDLLPKATLDQRIATGFNRNHMINAEEGAIAEEYRTEYVADRVHTTATVWLAQTMQCARCHDHKHDPFSMRDYYQLFAYFNNVPENGLDGLRGNAAPLIVAPTPQQAETLASLDRRLETLRREIEIKIAGPNPAQAAWEKRQQNGTKPAAQPPKDAILHLALDETDDPAVRDHVANITAATVRGSATWLKGKFGNGLLMDGESSIEITRPLTLERTDRFSFSVWLFPTTTDEMSVLYCGDESSTTSARRGFELSLLDRQLRLRMTHRANKQSSDIQPANEIAVADKQPLSLRQWHSVTWTYDGSSRAAGVRLFVNGQPRELTVEHDQLNATIRVDKPWFVGRRGNAAGFRGMIDDIQFFDRQLAADEVALLAGDNPLLAILALPNERRSEAQRRTVRRHFLENTDRDFARLLQAATDLQRERERLEKSFPTVMVMAEQPTARETFVLKRGHYDQRGERVHADVPRLFSRSSNAPQDRLGLARWLMSADNPLTARVTANRLWQLHFGLGLVKTSDDFGTHGEKPSHPELLDWLSDDLRNHSSLPWSMKRFQRMLVTSGTFRQQSRFGEVSPRWEFGPRQKLTAEMLRDVALQSGGLLTCKLGGPGIFPYQPAGLWEEVAFAPKELTAQSYRQSHGADLYRRSVYLFWKRAVPPPSLSIFDSPDREVCVAERTRSESPLQALVLMNEPLLVEAARNLAARMIREAQPSSAAAIVAAAPSSPDDIASHGFRLVTSRRPTETERKALVELYRTALADFRLNPSSQPAAADRLLTVGESPRPTSKTLSAEELAAWSVVANVLLSLDETVTNH